MTNSTRWHVDKHLLRPLGLKNKQIGVNDTITRFESAAYRHRVL